MMQYDDDNRSHRNDPSQQAPGGGEQFGGSARTGGGMGSDATGLGSQGGGLEGGGRLEGLGLEGGSDDGQPGAERIDRPASGADLEGGDGSFGSEGGGGDYSGVHSEHEGDPDKSDELRG